MPPTLPTISPPDIAYDTSENSYRPSWSEQRGYINSEHERIFEATKHIPGFQDLADSEKLYEVAYHCGAIILDLGVFGVRSPVVQLRGALAAPKDGRGEPPPHSVLGTAPTAHRPTYRHGSTVDMSMSAKSRQRSATPTTAREVLNAPERSIFSFGRGNRGPIA